MHFISLQEIIKLNFIIYINIYMYVCMYVCILELFVLLDVTKSV